MGHCSCCAHTHECAPEKHIEKQESIFSESVSYTHLSHFRRSAFRFCCRLGMRLFGTPSGVQLYVQSFFILKTIEILKTNYYELSTEFKVHE